MSEVIKRLKESSDPLENDLALVYEHWQQNRRQSGLTASLGYEPRDINLHGVEEVISSRVLKSSSGFEEVNPELSYEALVLNYRTRFSDDVILAAEKRIRDGDSRLVEFGGQDIQFLIKCYPSELFDNYSALEIATDWPGKAANIPNLTKANSYAKKFLQSGFKSFVWFHENTSTGEHGQGLTALVQFGPLSDDDKAQVIEAIIFERPIGKELIESNKAKNLFFADLDSSRHKKTWPIGDCDVAILLSAHREKIHLIDSYEAANPDPENELNLERTDDEFSLRNVIVRRNQQAFRKQLLSVRPNQCAITGTEELSVLEAAHIIPYSERFADRDKVENGLLLRSDIHKLFDAHLIAIEPNSRTVVVSKKLNSAEYIDLQGRKISDRVSSKSLQFHFKKFEN